MRQNESQAPGIDSLRCRLKSSHSETLAQRFISIRNLGQFRLSTTNQSVTRLASRLLYFVSEEGGSHGDPEDDIAGVRDTDIDDEFAERVYRGYASACSVSDPGCPIQPIWWIYHLAGL